MNKVSQALDQPNCNKPSSISKQAYSILIITLVVLACSTILDHAAHDAVNESLSSALITFGSASLLDSVVSMFKSFEVSVGVASFDLGQMLNSISDMLDLFKHTMALALASLSLQKFLLITMSSKLFNALVLLSGIGLLATIWTGKLTPFKESDEGFQNITDCSIRCDCIGFFISCRRSPFHRRICKRE
ncbi:hypothetical protein [Vibrio gigantis]|uniref:hypothetical protein n=1 Tax=Vibrio gigantis TaxID=296199 RepID=UPI0035A5E7E1